MDDRSLQLHHNPRLAGKRRRRPTFLLHPQPKAYAKWRGDRLGKDLAANCGVIGAAYFWNQAELDQYYEAHPSIAPHGR